MAPQRLFYSGVLFSSSLISFIFITAIYFLRYSDQSLQLFFAWVAKIVVFEKDGGFLASSLDGKHVLMKVFEGLENLVSDQASLEIRKPSIDCPSSHKY